MASSLHSGMATCETGRTSGRWPSPRTRPEDIFLAWLIALPDNADPVDAARIEIARIDRTGLANDNLSRLRALFAELAQTAGARA